MDVNELIQRKLVHEIHTSERKSFRACRRRWDWIFRQNYYPIMTAKPLEFGSAYHKAMETFYDPATWDWDREVIGAQAVIDFVEMCEQQKKKAIEAGNMLYLDHDVEEDYAERVELGRGMLEYFFKEVSPKLDQNWRPMHVEIAFMVPIRNPETGEDVIWCKCDTCWGKWVNQDPNWVAQHADAHKGQDAPDHWRGLPVVYAGRIDALGKDDNNNLWIIDWKTAAAIREDKEFLYLDDQVGSYPWALQKLGVRVSGFIYHEQKKGFPEPPKRNASRRLGRAFSVSKSQNTDYDTYLRTVSTEDTEAYEEGLYDEFLEFLKNDGIVFYDRRQIAKSLDELEEIEYNIGLEALDMIDPNLRIYPSPGRFGCNFCAFRQPCMEKNARGDYQYALDTMFEKREHYYVREAPSTESKGGE